MADYRINVTVNVYNEERKWGDAKRVTTKQIEVTIPAEIADHINIEYAVSGVVNSAIETMKKWDAEEGKGEENG